MELNEAWRIFHDYYGKEELSEIDLNAFIEASENLIFHKELDDLNRMVVMFNLASFYYDLEIYNLAEKYFTAITEEYPDDEISCCMAYVSLAKMYYNGRIDGLNPDKAYEYVCKALECDDDFLPARVLELTLDGLGSVPSADDYVDKVFDLYEEVHDRNVPGVWSIPIPEIDYLVAQMATASEDNEYAHHILKEAKNALLHRMLKSNSPDDWQLMWDLYYMDPELPEPSEFTIYDLLWILEVGDAEFWYEGKQYDVVTYEGEEDEPITVYFEDKYYRSPFDFLNKAKIDGKKINRIADKISQVQAKNIRY